ncbi:MAG: DUF423 domain-containing protein [Betaproteobacteria bacterium]|nr:DUF423 domain-containing protein [Betaproteobacteria bacterium]MDE2622655.1 DUF423 domain-containing protein [Betaproteobacteria bacterium]
MSFNPVLFGALLAATGVALGAFGAHGLRHVLSPAALEWWHTAVEYQMWHGLGLIGLGAVRAAGLKWAEALLGAGTVIFSGSLYLLAITGLHWLGMVTPLGGLLIILGWLTAAWQLRGLNRQNQ